MAWYRSNADKKGRIRQDAWIEQQLKIRTNAFFNERTWLGVD
jgi:hypothetical protein